MITFSSLLSSALFEKFKEPVTTVLLSIMSTFEVKRLRLYQVNPNATNTWPLSGLSQIPGATHFGKRNPTGGFALRLTCLKFGTHPPLSGWGKFTGLVCEWLALLLFAHYNKIYLGLQPGMASAMPADGLKAANIEQNNILRRRF